jgi:serine/threonine protein kinase/WD40 repeat protein
MSESTHQSPEAQAKLEAVLAEYLRSVENGRPLDRQSLLAAHPDLADDLESFFQNRDAMQRLAEPLKAAADGPTLVAAVAGAGRDGKIVRYFGDYELVEEIARGGMGIVYRARQINLNRVVALKMILSGQLAHEADVKRFYAEAEAAARLDHPGIVPIFEIGEHEGQHYFSMAFIEGQSLAGKVAGGPIPPREAAELVSRVAEAVQYAHDKGIIHRDLKPANVLLDRTGQPRVTDFGLAKQLAGDSGLTGSGQVLGTPGYMPPEQAAGRVSQIGPQSDVYSLGAILYCLLTGRPPFQAASPMDTLMQVLEQEPVPVRQLNARVARDLETICLKCLEKDPRRRYVSAQELSEDLQRFLAGRPIRARPNTIFERAAKWVKRRPAAAGLLASAIVVPLILLLGSLWFTIRLREERNYAQGQETLAKARLWSSLYEQARAERLVGNRSRALEILAEAARAKRTPELRREAIEAVISPGLALRHEIPFGSAQVVKFSPDGSYVAVHGKWGYGPGWQSGDPPDADVSRLMVWALPSGKLMVQKRLPLTSGENFWLGSNSFIPSTVAAYEAFALSPRSGWGAIKLMPEQKIQFWDLAADQLATTIDAPAFTPILFNRDGALVALLSKENPTQTQIWNVDEGQPAGKPVIGQPVAFVGDEELIVADGARLRRVNFHSGDVLSATPEDALWLLAVSHDGRMAAVSKEENIPGNPVVIWDLIAGRELATLPNVGHRTYRQSYELQFSPDGRLLAFHQTPEPNSVKIWGCSSNTMKASFPGVVCGEGTWNQYQTAAFSPNGSMLATYVRTKSADLQIWDTESQRPCGALRSDHSPLWSPDGRWLATIGPGKVKLAVNNALYDFVQAGGASALSTLSPATEHAAGELVLFDRAGTVATVDFPVDSMKPKPFAVAGLARGQSDRVLSPPDASPLNRPQNAEELAGFTSSRKLVSWDPVGNRLAILARAWWQSAGNEPQRGGTYSSDYDGCLAVWNLNSDRRTPVWTDFPRKLITCLATSPDGKYLAAGDQRGVQFYDLADGKKLQFFECARKWTSYEKLEEGWTQRSGSGGGLPWEYVKSFPVHDLRFSPDGTRLYAAADEGRIFSFEAATGRELAVWEGHEGAVLALALHPDGKLIASGGTDRTIRIWDADSGQELAAGEAHRAEVSALAFDAEGAWLASGSSDGSVKLWNLPWVRQELARLGLE